MAHLTKAKILLEVEYAGPAAEPYKLFKVMRRVKKHTFTVLEAKTEDLGVDPGAKHAHSLNLKRILRDTMKKLGFALVSRNKIFSDSVCNIAAAGINNKCYSMSGFSRSDYAFGEITVPAHDRPSGTKSVSFRLKDAEISAFDRDGDEYCIQLADPDSFKKLGEIIAHALGRQKLGLELELPPWTEQKSAP